MKNAVTALTLILSGCGTVQWVRAPQVNESDCTASCNAHYDQCPQIFAGFPERGAVECPAERNNCVKACTSGPHSTHVAATTPASASPAAALPESPATSSVAVGSREARLRELKNFYDEGLVTEDVYRDRQKVILAEP